MEELGRQMERLTVSIENQNSHGREGNF
jgi:hypothetical protein